MLKVNFIKDERFSSVFFRENGSKEPEVFHKPNLNEIKTIAQRILFSVPTPNELRTKLGGTWLGFIREFIQSRFLNGDSVTWGSNDVLRTPRSFTVAEMETLAADVTHVAFKERSDSLQSLIGFLIHEIELREKKICEIEKVV